MSTITTAAGLDALPVGSVVRANEDGGSTVAEKNRYRLWGIAGVPVSGTLAVKSEHLAVNAPFVVLYRPDCEPERTVAEIKAEALREAAETAEDALSESEHQQWDYDWICYLRETADRLEGEARP